MGFPLELITMLGSTLLGGVMSIWGQALKARIENNKMLLQRAEFRAGAVNTAREYGSKDKHFAWTRRLIALGAVGAIIVLPKVAAIFYPEVGAVVGYTEVDGGILSWLLGGHESVVWREAAGFVFTPLDTHMVSAIVGLYFGAGFTK